MKLPTIRNYVNYSSDNYGAHSLEVSFDSLTLYYYYKTIIAFIYKGKQYVRVNDWSTTTGKHLNAIDNGDKKSRMQGDDFEKLLTKTLKKLRLMV